MKKKTRYFIVFYTATNSTGGYNIGDTEFYRTDGEFLNRKETAEQILQINAKFEKVVINSILELNKKDYENWIKK